MLIFAFICPYQLFTFKKKVTFYQLFSRPGPCDPYICGPVSMCICVYLYVHLCVVCASVGVCVCVCASLCLLKTFCTCKGTDVDRIYN